MDVPEQLLEELEKMGVEKVRDRAWSWEPNIFIPGVMCRGCHGELVVHEVVADGRRWIVGWCLLEGNKHEDAAKRTVPCEGNGPILYSPTTPPGLDVPYKAPVQVRPRVEVAE